MSLEISDRFEAGEDLCQEDGEVLRGIIFKSEDIEALTLSIGTYCQAFQVDIAVAAKIKEILVNEAPPNLAAACLRCIVDGSILNTHDTLEIMRKFVDFSKYNEYTDEVIIASGFFRRNVQELSSFDRRRLSNVIQEASRFGANELVELLL